MSKRAATHAHAVTEAEHFREQKKNPPPSSKGVPQGETQVGGHLYVIHFFFF